MDILLDGQPRRVDAGISLQSLMDELGLAPTDAATAINGEFVARGSRADRLLQGGDSVMLFRAIVGG
ncbi:sulfur carrier protein ThiS [Piscinibacter terrae]|uniref:Sulfur carrier protein ThiS n=1 Tax=Piscinibacter terrae TaxID=2496871 RepID=A0A3N7HQH5_9BURK|nr:sulfur carrier protein ThiS [Albitalea terrae]RQP23943.1 sulfur carrier protein ThiS [Albitalea terrae]